jgi:hypothetical protein
MAALLVNLLALASAFVPVPVVQPPQDYTYYAAAPATEFLGRADVVMNTAYGDPAVANYRKKNPKSGRSALLKGYRTGSRAPATAIRSGTVNQYGYGIGNLYGGAVKVKKAQEDKFGRPTSFSVGGGGIQTQNSLTRAGPALLAAALFLFVISLAK